MSSTVLLLMVQIDDATGELLGEVMKDLAELGAKNIQLLSSMAKKGRPGYVLMIDILAEQEAEIASLLVGELGVWGYRVLHSDHKHFEIDRHTIKLEIELPNGTRQEFDMRIKRILNEGEFLRVKAENDDLNHIRKTLSADGARCSLTALKAQVETVIGSRIPEGRIEIRLG